jgi:membrane-associated phospholipid phosphatase
MVHQGQAVGTTRIWQGVVSLEEHVRRALFLYVLGTIVILQLYFVLFSLVPQFSPSPTRAVWFTALFFPGGLVAAGLRLRRPGPSPEATPEVPYGWLVLMLAAFGFWAGMYLLTGHYSRLMPPVDVATTWDSAIPLRPVFSFLYLTVYSLFLLPFLVARSPNDLALYVMAQVAPLLVSYALFFLIPVAFPHPPVPATDFLSWVLNQIYSGDTPANCYPSTHCSTGTVAALMLYRLDRRLGAFGFITATGLAFATLYTHQHYIADVVAGVALGAVAYGLAAQLLPLHSVQRYTALTLAWLTRVKA